MKNTPYIIKCFDLKREHGKSKKNAKKQCKESNYRNMIEGKNV